MPDESPPPRLSSVKNFFEQTPPGNWQDVTGVAKSAGRSGWLLNAPPIQLHCKHADCEGVRFFDTESEIYVTARSLKQFFIAFVCRNCKSESKTYAVWSILNEDMLTGKMYKFGEIPQFGPPTPARVISLIGGERDYYLKGRRAENQGLGIAAFAYYRRVVENQKHKIIEEVLRVARKIGATPEVISDLESAKVETQFSLAVAQVKHGIPQALLINGHNPLTLLHSALSEGLHAQTDEECLELATSIRVVLTDLVERISNALKEEVELATAVSRLLQTSSQKAQRGLDRQQSPRAPGSNEEEDQGPTKA